MPDSEQGREVRGGSEVTVPRAAMGRGREIGLHGLVDGGGW